MKTQYKHFAYEHNDSVNALLRALEVTWCERVDARLEAMDVAYREFYKTTRGVTPDTLYLDSKTVDSLFGLPFGVIQHNARNDGGMACFWRGCAVYPVLDNEHITFVRRGA